MSHTVTDQYVFQKKKKKKKKKYTYKVHFFFL